MDTRKPIKSDILLRSGAGVDCKRRTEKYGFFINFIPKK